MNPLRLSVSTILLALSAAAQPTPAFDPATFKSPPAEYRGHAMWNFNLPTLNEKDIISGIQEMKRLNYGGFFIEAGGRGQPGQGVAFLSPEYFRYYNIALEEAKKDGLEVILYDDYAFPTGTVGGQMLQQHPDLVAKSLDMVEKDVTGPATAELTVPAGPYIGAVMMNRDTHDLVDISTRKQQDKVVAQVPAGKWKVMAFYLVTGKTRVVDYLDENAMSQFISMTYEKYQQNFGSYFGNLIKQTFYDEPSMHHADRMWTTNFNQYFEKQYGYSPMKYYPALWYDIGPQTAAARNALFGFRGDLFARNFIKRLNDWCADHHLIFGGHLDQEEPLNPTPLNGDLLKVFQYQSAPTVDDIWWYGRSNPSYKIVTSAAFNYDHPIIRAETYAAYRILDEKIAYQVAMDQFAMGINYQIPARTPQPKRPELNDYVGRLSYVLQHGRHVSDIAVLYPIASMHAQYRNLGGVTFPMAAGAQAPQIMETAYAREGGPAFGADYQDLGESLFRALRVDYTYLHPEVLAEHCIIEGNKLILNNRENREEYSVLFVPAGDTLSVSAAAKIREFYQHGGTVIATGLLPTKSSEFNKDKDVQEAIYDVFGVSPDEPLTADVRRAQDRQNFYVFWYYIKKNKSGGQALFLPNTNPWLVDYALKLVLPRRDVDIQEPMAPIRVGSQYEGALTYIHKVKDGRDIYFFANSTAKPVDAKVVLRGKKALAIWNPHTGEQQAAEFTNTDSATTLHLTLPPVTSLFYIQQ
ncbi:MAG TPA: glycosyl hydrolase [Candidatus Limnocylindrales bacterium]|nr:glycosyl hydrolase [Candidatus Limnocylindrales bacterium]